MKVENIIDSIREGLENKKITDFQYAETNGGVINIIIEARNYHKNEV